VIRAEAIRGTPMDELSSANPLKDNRFQGKKKQGG
jgi:hypothetical protein